MLTSEFKSNLKTAGQVIFIVVLTSLLLIWLNHRSLDRFWQQKYHQQSPWAALHDNPLWDLGDNLEQAVLAAGEAFVLHTTGNNSDNHQQAPLEANITLPAGFQIGLKLLGGYTSPIANLPATFPELLQKSPHTNSVGSSVPHNSGNSVHSSIVITKTNVTLTAKDKVLFAGDSMMQGIAPHLKRRLYQDYGVSSINLSKQSTGLAYPSFFNWPETIDKALEANHDIKLVVIFLGPNDPWDMPPKHGSTYLKFASSDWENLYRQRIDMILTETRNHGADVIWIGPPNMRQKKLSANMEYLRSLYQSEVAKAGEIYVSVNDIFKYHTDDYSDYIGDNSNKIKLRSGDGIHFSLKGQQTISDNIFSLLEFIQEPDKQNGKI
ncbi:SGNH/GDSL hydrolase family protein [Photorhabdus sp. SF281]|uniref:SGNH/GDSL hydrolase family protein n=1 Tax=Photorhabdus sp. SF281 TaxID=3459527 RepID=UPI0040441EE0